MDFHKLDLNLLRVLAVLLEEKNTYKTAERLNTTQPTISRNLARLREAFGDPLFIRHKRGLKLSGRAEQLEKALPSMLSQLQLTIEGEVFVPEKLSGLFRIAMNGYLIEVYGAQIYQALAQVCPNIELEILSYSSKTHEHLLSDYIQLGITYHLSTASKALYQKVVGANEFGLIARKGLLPEGEVLPLADFKKYVFCGLIIPGMNERAMLLRDLVGPEFRVAFRSQQLNPLLDVLKTSDYLFALPELLTLKLDLSAFQFIPVEPGTVSAHANVALIYNSRHAYSDKYLWLEQLVLSVMADSDAALQQWQAER
jgi:DNA-binding transcriptional LysR family regulator